MNENIIPHQHAISALDRIEKLGYKPQLIWFVGLSGSGKSTIAGRLEQYLFGQGLNTYILDGDNIRSGLNSDLDFSYEGRKENIRRIAEVCKLFLDAGVVILTAFITPFAAERERVKNLVGREHYTEVFVNCPLEICEQRDVKGLYAKVRRGEIKHFTGIDAPFEAPENADVEIHSHEVSVEDAIEKILEVVKDKLDMRKTSTKH